jgi:hypothetical protein
MSITRDNPAGRPLAVALVNRFDASNFGRKVTLTRDDESSSATLSRPFTTLGSSYPASIEPAAAGCDFLTSSATSGRPLATFS